MEHKIETKDSKKEKTEDSSATILTINGDRYTKKMLLDRMEKIGLLDDYLGGEEVTNRTKRWVEPFSKEDILQIFANFPEVYERCKELLGKKIGPSILTISTFDDTFCNLFENALTAAKEIHVKHSWSFGADTEEFHKFEFAISLLYTYIEEDYRFSTKQKERSITKALDKFAESDFVNLDQSAFQLISSQLYNITRQGSCSGGFTEQLSRIYTALTLARTVIYYQSLLEEKTAEETEEQSSSVPAVTWNYHRSALFFKPKQEIQKEMVHPLYHGDIDTGVARDILKSPGQYLARYSSNQKSHYLTILLSATTGVKIVLNFTIPPVKVETWMKNPMENRAEIEAFIKEMLIKIKENTGTPEQAVVIKFLEHEHYSPVFNSVSNTDMLSASPKSG